MITRWNLVSAETVKIAELPAEFYPTDMHYLPRSSAGGRKKGGAVMADTYLVTSADGKLQGWNICFGN